MWQREVAAMRLVAWLGIGLKDARAQDTAKEPPKLGWSNSTDLSLIVAAGNSAAHTWGFTDELRHTWKDARFLFEANVVRSDTSDDRFFQVAPGLEFPSDPSDYSIDTTSALTVSVVSPVSLKVSLQWLYEHEPALESDLDVIAFVEVINQFHQTEVRSRPGRIGSLTRRCGNPLLVPGSRVNTVCSTHSQRKARTYLN